MNDVACHLNKHISINLIAETQFMMSENESYKKKSLGGRESSFLGFPNEEAVLWRDGFLQHHCQ